MLFYCLFFRLVLFRDSNKELDDKKDKEKRQRTHSINVVDQIVGLASSSISLEDFGHILSLRASLSF